MWILITGMFCLNLGDIVSPSLLTETIYATGLLCFGLGAVFAINRNSNQAIYQSSNYNTYIRYDYSMRFIAAVAICWYIMSQAALRSLPYLLAGTEIGEIRYQMREEILGDINVPFIFIAEPLSYVIIHFCTLQIFKGNRIKTSAIIIIITALLTEICIGGRFFLYYIGFDFLFVYFSQKYKAQTITSIKKLKSNFWFRFLLTIIFFVLITAFVLLTGEGKVFSTIYSYFCGCIKLLDVKIQEFSTTENYTIFVTSFNGFIRPIFVLLRAVGLIGDLPQILQDSETYLLAVEEVTTEVSKDGGTFNGFVSLFYTFYVDLGYIGIVLYSFGWGFFSENIFLKMKYRGTDKDFMYYLLILQALSISMTRFAFCTYQYALSFVYIYFIFIVDRKVNSK